MKIEILRQTSIAGRPARVGEVHCVSDHDARTLLLMGKAIEAQEPSRPAGKQRKPTPPILED